MFKIQKLQYSYFIQYQPLVFIKLNFFLLHLIIIWAFFFFFSFTLYLRLLFVRCGLLKNTQLITYFLFFFFFFEKNITIIIIIVIIIIIIIIIVIIVINKFFTRIIMKTDCFLYLNLFNNILFIFIKFKYFSISSFSNICQIWKLIIAIKILLSYGVYDIFNIFIFLHAFEFRVIVNIHINI